MNRSLPWIAATLTAISLDAFAGDCVAKRLPDGTNVLECPSEAPPAPPEDLAMQLSPSEQDKAKYRASCSTSKGICIAAFANAMPRPGTRCYCYDGGGGSRLEGQILGRANSR